MAIYEVTVDSEGRITLPREIVTRVGARPGDRLGVAEIRSQTADVTETLAIRPIAPRPATRDSRSSATAAPPSAGGLDALKEIARRARAEGAKRAASADPIGDHLLEEDRRSRGL